MFKMSWLLTCCLLMFLVQGALSQEDDGGSESSGCPPLKIKAVRIVCINTDNEDQDCLQPETGTKARIMWKKNVIPGSGVTDLVCKSDGTWKRSAFNAKGGGSSGRRSGGDSDDDSGKRSGGGMGGDLGSRIGK